MNNKIQELTDIIYNEGVAKGQAQADQIIAQANDQAAKIVADAQKQADSLLAAARKEAADNAENVQKELRLHAAQAVEALKSEIATVVTDKIVQDSVKGFTADQKAFNEFMLRIAQEWGKNQQIEIKAQDADALTRYFNANAKALLDKGVKITQVNGQPAEFSIQPADGSYKVNFGTEEFMNWFKSMLRPQLVETLF
jgi:V/A-type H+-transporting ATPase subunit E